MSIYRQLFESEHRDKVLRSARLIVPLVLELYRPASAVDVGCGAGMWLSVLVEHGVSDVVGVDGDYVPRASLLIPPERFHARDLAQPLDLGRTFDLAVSLEVAEHIDASRADAFVAGLCALAPVVLFSAAVPHQGGLGHVNEQWPAFWLERFESHGFVAVDCLRRRLWDEPGVAWYYAQNSFLLVREDALSAHPALAAARDRGGDMPLSVVHPTLYQARVHDAENPGRLPLRALTGATTAALRRSVRYRLSKTRLIRGR